MEDSIREAPNLGFEKPYQQKGSSGSVTGRYVGANAVVAVFGTAEQAHTSRPALPLHPAPRTILTERGETVLNGGFNRDGPDFARRGALMPANL